MAAPTPAELELLRLARLLSVDPADVDGLLPIGAADLRSLRDQVAARLHRSGREAFERAATVAGMVPAGLAATLAQKGLGPVLSARTTAVTPPDKAADLAARMPPEFLADVAVAMDPQVADELLRRLPPDVIAGVGDVLAARGEWLAMADFVGSITDEALAATVRTLSDEAVLHVGRLLQDPARVDEVVGLLDDERLASLVATARARGLEEALEDLVGRLGEDQRARVPR